VTLIGAHDVIRPCDDIVPQNIIPFSNLSVYALVRIITYGFSNIILMNNIFSRFIELFCLAKFTLLTEDNAILFYYQKY
jgi:hypothetical protein